MMMRDGVIPLVLLHAHALLKLLMTVPAPDEYIRKEVPLGTITIIGDVEMLSTRLVHSHA